MYMKMTTSRTMTTTTMAMMTGPFEPPPVEALCSTTTRFEIRSSSSCSGMGSGRSKGSATASDQS
jgi:hypothetical protein